MTRTIALIALCLGLAFSGLKAQDGNLQTQERIRQLEEKLRCLVCQNQTLADSNAELAGDLRREVAEQVKSGKSDEQIIDYLVQRYGDFVLYDPPFKARTVLLWVGPFALFAFAAGVLVLVLRRRRAAPEEAPLGPEEKRLVERVLGPTGRDGAPR
jgi:cytochrome c-type biogenesis protein CcmH